MIDRFTGGCGRVLSELSGRLSFDFDLGLVVIVVAGDLTRSLGLIGFFWMLVLVAN